MIELPDNRNLHLIIFVTFTKIFTQRVNYVNLFNLGRGPSAGESLLRSVARRSRRGPTDGSIFTFAFLTFPISFFYLLHSRVPNPNSSATFLGVNFFPLGQTFAVFHLICQTSMSRVLAVQMEFRRPFHKFERLYRFQVPSVDISFSLLAFIE